LKVKRAKEIADWLVRNARRTHFVNWVTGGGHGEPAMDYIHDACPCVIHDGYKVIGSDESKGCNCGAMQHNALLDELVKALD